jgi:hypothetical protein
VEQKGNNVIHHLTISSAVLYHSQWQNMEHYIYVLSSFCINISDEEDFDLPSMSWIPTLYQSKHSNLEISQHVHDGIHFYDSMWNFCVIANLCMFLLSVYIYISVWSPINI